MPRRAEPTSDSSDLRINGGRSNRRHFAPKPKKKTSDQYEKKFKNVQYSADKWIPCPSGHTRGQGWNCLLRAWLGYKIAKNPKNGESIQDRIRCAVTIQNIQTDLGLQRSSFPDLGLRGDCVFTYNETKQMELEGLDFEMSLDEWEKKRRAHVKKNSGCILVIRTGKRVDGGVYTTGYDRFNL